MNKALENSRILSTERKIFITTQFEGLHCYPKAPEEVSYLRNMHRHIFKVKCTIAVQHNDREIEFILFKTKINEFLNKKYNVHADSCEDIALEIALYLINMYDRWVEVEVSEDGENGAIVTLTNQR
jgi:hypothetical protein